MKANDPTFGCVHPDCDEHPATGGGPIWRLSPKGQRFVGACLAHYDEMEAGGSWLAPDRGWDIHEPDDALRIQAEDGAR
jgi:hypothetical protein